MTALRFGFSVDEVSEAFDLGKVEAAVFQRATGEFSGLGETQARHRGKTMQNGGNGGLAAMKMEFHRRLAGKAVAWREGQNQCLIQHLPVSVPEGAKRALPRRRKRSGQRLTRSKRRRAREAQYRHPGLAACAGQGINRIHFV
ncbi:hypothetical protein GALL_544790 [mine drainage metagenome]|uniref:Uncharacterized protein n=1 Tax=mine drainage metagenome TaxID=410659 RepID=A0A1J5PKB1_9ZZZZ